MKQGPQVESFWNPEARREAIRLIRQGRPIATHVRTVCAIWGDGGSGRFAEEVRRIKGEARGHRPLGASMLADGFVALLDRSEIPPPLRHILLNARELSRRLGSLCFVRAAVREDVVSRLPPSIVSRGAGGRPVVQNWDPRGHRPVFLLIQEMLREGIVYPAVTSINVSGQPEIVDQNEGIAFSARAGIPLFLADPNARGDVRGSYTILGVGRDGVELARDGNLPRSAFEQLLDTPIRGTPPAGPRFPQAAFPPSLAARLDPGATRLAVICWLRGWPEERIQKALRELHLAERPRQPLGVGASDGGP